MGAITVRNIADSYVSSATPKKNYGSVNRMFVGTGFFSYLFWGNPAPKGAKILNAKLHVYGANAWAGSITLFGQRMIGPWSANKVNWNNDPAITGANQASQVKSGAGIGTHWILDITAMMQDVSDGAPWYGVKLSASGGATKALFSMQAAANRRPWVELSWSDAPLPPNNQVPRDAQVVSTSSPTLSWNFTDVSGNRNQAAYQVQIATDVGMISLVHDSGTVAGSIPHYDLGIRVNDILNSTFEVDAANWSALTNTTISRQTTFAHAGAASLRLSSTAAGDMKAQSSAMAVVPNEVFKADAFVRSGASARSCRLEIVWKDAAGATLSTTVGSNVTSSTANFTTALTVSATAPATAATAIVNLVVLATAAGAELHYFDDVTFSVTPIFVPLTASTTYYWRVKTQDGAGLWSAWSSVEAFKYLAPFAVTLSSPSSGSAFVEEPTPPISWTYTGVQSAYEILLYDGNTLLWDSGRVTSGNLYATIPAGKIVDQTTTYTVFVRVWDTQNRVATPGVPPYVETSQDFVYQYAAAVTPVNTFTVTQDSGSPAYTLQFFRATLPDYFTIVRNGKVIANNIVAASIQDAVDPTKFTFKDFPPGRRAATWEVSSVVNGRGSASNPTVTKTVQRNLSWLQGIEDPTVLVGFANPVHDLQDGDNSSVMYSNSGPPALVTQSLFGESGPFAGIIAENIVTGLTARQMKDNLRIIRKTYGGRGRLIFSDETMEVYIHNIKVQRISNPDGTTEYAVTFEFFQVA